MNARRQEIVNLPVVKGSNYLKIQEFYESVSRNYDALLSLGKADMLRRFVISTLNKTASKARYCANRRKLGELGYGGFDKQPSAVVEKTQSR